MSASRLDPRNTLFLLCDVQTRFRSAIHGFDAVVASANKLLRVAKTLEIRVVATTQNAKALGPIDPAIDLDALGPLLLGNYDKTLFSMLIPPVIAHIKDSSITNVVVFGIESHVCVLQTALDLLSNSAFPGKVYIVADGVSSCNAFEVPIALQRLRSEGAVVTTSESIAFQLIGDASSDKFKAFSAVIKETKGATKEVGRSLLCPSGNEQKSSL
ncbi:Isochorismatase hydrolase [Schizophyllum amplum]|uniref:Isochorismatase hydrolase n=1 Tax=Schizophyllum amplum TaxID=97359 RepID=A0A550CUP4_9AGAR|nr:Isochorismatase hydrolase [Auriculariopsis ampla]